MTISTIVVHKSVLLNVSTNQGLVAGLF